MNNRFNHFIPFILKWECDYPNRTDGQYEHDPHDPGGETKWGIDRRSHPDNDIKNLTYNQAVQIYWEAYWLKNSCDNYVQGLGEVYMNACVNCGAFRASKFLNHAVDLTQPKEHWASRFLDIQEDFYRDLASSHKGLQKFLKGWLNRTSDLRKWVAENVPITPSVPSQVPV